MIEYFKYEVSVKINTYQDLPATFPAVTICNTNPFNELYAFNYTFSKLPEAACFKLRNGYDFSKCLNSTATNSAYDAFLEN